MPIDAKNHNHPKGGSVLTIAATNTTAGQASDWFPIARTDVGADLKVSSGSFTVQVTCAAGDNLANAVITEWPSGAVAGPGSANDGISDFAHIRLMCAGSGSAELSVRT